MKRLSRRDVTGRRDSGPDNTGIVVSVIVPVYNVEPYLRQCLDSVLTQSIGGENIELITVDDGSTDGSAQLLDEYAAKYDAVRVFHEPNSGGPGRPRNVGLDNARGTYVFFLDADDYLGPEALERLVAMAERNASDIVLGKMVGIEGRQLPEAVFRRTRERARLTDVYASLNVLKLFRCELIERVGVRFAEGVKGGEDGPFAAELMLAASTISVVGDYDCYFCRSRPGSQTKRPSTEHPSARLLRMAQRAELLARHVPPGRRRDRLMARHVRDILRPFGRAWLALPEDDRRRMFELGTTIIRRWSNERVHNMLSPYWAVRAHCLMQGQFNAMEDIVAAPRRRAFRKPIIDGSRVFASYPHFRDHYAIPDRYFEFTKSIRLNHALYDIGIADGKLLISGIAYLSYIGGSTKVVLRRWPWGEEHLFATVSVASPQVRDKNGVYPHAGFDAVIDLRSTKKPMPLAPGPWQIRLAIEYRTLHRETALRCPLRLRSAIPRLPALPHESAEPAALYRSADDSLRLRVAGRAPVSTALERALASVERVLLPARRRALAAAKRFASRP
jgi:poly(ribitol-phosphate) beta-N-acetylglucosaminyltransferase